MTYSSTDQYPLLKNPHKYVGKRPIVFRSTWESKFARHRLDLNEEVVQWSSESIIIPYIHPIKKTKWRYFMDFWFRRNDGQEFLIEIKPYWQTQPPKITKRTKNPRGKQQEYMKNMSKWAATDRYVKHLRKQGREIEFALLTEKNEPLFRKSFV